MRLLNRNCSGWAFTILLSLPLFPPITSLLSPFPPPLPSGLSPALETGSFRDVTPKKYFLKSYIPVGEFQRIL